MTDGYIIECRFLSVLTRTHQREAAAAAVADPTDPAGDVQILETSSQTPNAELSVAAAGPNALLSGLRRSGSRNKDLDPAAATAGPGAGPVGAASDPQEEEEALLQCPICHDDVESARGNGQRAMMPCGHQV